MNVETLEEILSKVKDKKLLVSISVPYKGVDDEHHDEYPNYWLNSIFVHNKGDSGYEQNGEVTLWGSEE